MDDLGVPLFSETPISSYTFTIGISGMAYQGSRCSTLPQVGLEVQNLIPKNLNHRLGSPEESMDYSGSNVKGGW